VNEPVWNRIDFKAWARGKISVGVNNFGEGPIIVGIGGDGYETYDLEEWMTPAEARDFATKLMGAADAVDAAGLNRKR
jgi:hypothetical protein